MSPFQGRATIYFLQVYHPNQKRLVFSLFFLNYKFFIVDKIHWHLFGADRFIHLLILQVLKHNTRIGRPDKFLQPKPAFYR